MSTTLILKLSEDTKDRCDYCGELAVFRFGHIIDLCLEHATEEAGNAVMLVAALPEFPELEQDAKLYAEG